MGFGFFLVFLGVLEMISAMEKKRRPVITVDRQALADLQRDHIRLEKDYAERTAEYEVRGQVIDDLRKKHNDFGP